MQSWARDNFLNMATTKLGFCNTLKYEKSMPLGNGVFTPVMRHENFFCSIIVRLWRLVVGCAQLWAMRVCVYLGAGEYIVATSCGMCPALGYACTVPGSRGIYRVLTVDLLTVLRTFIKLYDVHHFIDND